MLFNCKSHSKRFQLLQHRHRETQICPKMIRQGKSWSHVLEPTWCVSASSCWQPLPERTPLPQVFSPNISHLNVFWDVQEIGPLGLCVRKPCKKKEKTTKKKETNGFLRSTHFQPASKMTLCHFDPSDSECVKCMYCICETELRSKSSEFLLSFGYCPGSRHSPPSRDHANLDPSPSVWISWKSKPSRNWPYLLKGDIRIFPSETNCVSREKKHISVQSGPRHIIALLLLLKALMWLASTQDWCHCSGGMKMDFWPISLPHTSRLLKVNSTSTTNISLQRPLKSGNTIKTFQHEQFLDIKQTGPFPCCAYDTIQPHLP